MVEMFLWSAMCSANTTSATGAKVTNIETTPANPSNLDAPSLNIPRKVKFGSHSLMSAIFAKGSKLTSCK